MGWIEYTTCAKSELVYKIWFTRIIADIAYSLPGIQYSLEQKMALFFLYKTSSYKSAINLCDHETLEVNLEVNDSAISSLIKTIQTCWQQYSILLLTLS